MKVEDFLIDSIFLDNPRRGFTGKPGATPPEMERYESATLKGSKSSQKECDPFRVGLESHTVPGALPPAVL